MRAPRWAATGSLAAIAAASTPAGAPKLTAVEAAASGTLAMFTPSSIVGYFATKEGRKGQMVESAIRATKTASRFIVNDKSGRGSSSSSRRGGVPVLRQQRLEVDRGDGEARVKLITKIKARPTAALNAQYQ